MFSLGGGRRKAKLRRELSGARVFFVARSPARSLYFQLWRGGAELEGVKTRYHLAAGKSGQGL
jgi:hypothetical protein